jgi:hypothetical protein
MTQLIADGSAYGLVDVKDVKFGGLAPKKDAALKIVVQDYQRSVAWLGQKQWALRWKESQERYEPQRIHDTWEGTDIPRSCLNVYAVSTIVESIMAKTMEGLFSDDPPFQIQSRPKTTAECGRAWSTLLHFQVEECGFRQEVEDGASDAVLFGTNIWKVLWHEHKRQTRTYKRAEDPASLPSPAPGVPGQLLHTAKSDEIIPVVKTKTFGKPVLENQDLRMTFVNPGLRRPDIRKAKYVITKRTVSAEELEEMRDWEGYTIPSAEELKLLVASRATHAESNSLETQQTAGGAWDHQAMPRDIEDTADPLADTSRFELLERWDKRKVMVALNQAVVIRNEEHDLPSVPYFSVGLKRVPNSFYSMGVGITAGDEQEIQRGLINALLDQTSFNLNLPYLTVKGVNELTQHIRMYMGKVIPVEDPTKVKPMERLQAVPEASMEVQQSEARAEASSGANEQMVQGSTPSQGRTSLGRTATGANLLAGGSGSRIESFVSRLADQVIVPALYMFMELDKQLLDPEQVRDILSDEMDTAWNEDHIELFNAKIKVDILAAGKMVARQRMAQSLPLLAQALLTDPIHSMLQMQGMKLDVNELINMWFDISGWRNKNDLVVPMNDEDKERMAQMNPGVQQTQTNAAKIAGQTNSKLQVIDADNSARAFREMERATLEHALTQSEEQGNPIPNPNSFGGS